MGAYWPDFNDGKVAYLLCIKATPGQLTLGKTYRFTFENIHGPDGFIIEDDGNPNWFDMPSNKRFPEMAWQSSDYFKEL
jgi:hypothetical protein